MWLGGTLLQLGEVDEGMAALETAEQLEPDNPDVHQRPGARVLAVPRHGAGRHRRTAPSDCAQPRRAATRTCQLSMLEALSGHLDEAETSARQAIELQERAMSGTEGLLIVGAHARLGYVHYLRGNYDAAAIEYRRELEYVTTSDHALRERTLIELHQKFSALSRARGDQEAAKRFGDMAIEAHTRRVANGADDPASRYYMAALYAAGGDVERTREHLELPLAGCPSSPGGGCSATGISIPSDLVVSILNWKDEPRDQIPNRHSSGLPPPATNQSAAVSVARSAVPMAQPASRTASPVPRCVSWTC